MHAQGDVVYFDVFGQPLIALNSLQAVEDLVVKKSAIFCGRPHLTMCQDLSVCVLILCKAGAYAASIIEPDGSKALPFCPRLSSGRYPGGSPTSSLAPRPYRAITRPLRAKRELSLTGF